MAIFPVDTSKLISAMGLPPGTTLTVLGDPSAYGLSNGTLAGFSGGFLSPYLVLSTGQISDITSSNFSGSQGTDLGASGVDGDTVTLSFDIPLPSDAASFSFDFTFLSEEFPEYVGSNFNDFLSVKLNGVEIARDTSGNSISVNNNFFSPSLIPSGTMFDGQTPPLRINAPLNTNAQTANLTITLGDVGDGIYDSAAFLGKFKFIKPQIVYVNFDGGSIGWESFLFDKNVSLPTSGKSASEQTAIINDLNNIYKDFLITFTNQKPPSGEYSTILVGGTTLSLPSWFGAKSGLLGRAEKIDYGNADRGDDALVLSGHIGSDNALLTQVIAHEAGHILGLRHVSGVSELMYPYANPTSRTIGGSTPLAEIKNNAVTPVGGAQDSFNELSKNLGLKNSSKVLVSDSPLSTIQKYFSFSLDPTSKTIYDANIAIVNEEGEVVSLYGYGSIKPGATVEFSTAAASTDRVVVLGSTKNGGSVNAFLGGSSSLKKFNVNKEGEDGVLAKFGIEVGKLGSATLGLKAADSKGNLSSIGKVSVMQSSIDTLQATDGDDRIAGTSGRDKIAGLGGADLMLGFGGADVLFGGTDNDTLFGGSGKDTLFGGPGADTFVFDSKPSRTTNVDTIKDFNVRNDSIYLDNAVFTKVGSKGSLDAPAKLNKAFFKIGDKAADKNDYLIYNKITGVLSYDADGSGAGKAVEIAKLSKNLKLNYHDFFVV